MPERPINVFELVLHLFEANHVVLTIEQTITDALWILHTYVFDQFLHTPRLLLRSTEPECGKTTLLSLMARLVDNEFTTSNTSAAVLYYQLRDHPHTTLLIDEVEHSSLWTHDPLLLSVFDAGHRRGGCVTRVLNGKVVRFPVFAPLALAAVPKKRFAPQLLSRAIPIDMVKYPEGKDELLPDDPQFAAVRGLICEWASAFKRPQACKTPFTGRARDNWQPLIEIAQVLGYGATARAAAFALHRPSDDPVILLLFDIHRVFEQRGTDRIWTPELLKALHQLPDAKWDEFAGIEENQNPHELTRAELYWLLGTKRIYSRSVWKTTGRERECNKGFLREQFEPLWHGLFGDTPAQRSKIIRLPRHNQRHAGGTE